MAGDLRTVQSGGTTHRGAGGGCVRRITTPPGETDAFNDPARGDRRGAPPGSLWDKPTKRPAGWRDHGQDALVEVTQRTLVKAIARVKKIQKLFSPLDGYLLVTAFVKNITSIFEKRSSSS